MESPFDIAADLDTPVSAYIKLAPFKPRFLLESVESGEKLARYSFLGFGEGLTLEIRADGVRRNGVALPRPKGRDEWLALMRDALAASPKLEPAIEGLPFTGGLVGAAGYDVVRYFERLPPNRAELPGLPEAVFVAPESLLVFDHLTRRVALLHAGSEDERRAIRAEVIRALRGGIDRPARTGGFSPAEPSFSRDAFLDAVDRAKRHIAAGDIYQIVLSERFSGRADLDPFQTYRGLRLLNPSPYMYFFRLGSLSIAGSSPEALVRLEHGHASLRPIAGTRPRGATRDDDLALENVIGDANPEKFAERLEVFRQDQEKKLDRQKQELKAQTQRQIQETENKFWLYAVLLPPIPAIILGLSILLNRLLRERREVDPERAVRT